MSAANDSLDTLNIVKMSFTLYAVFLQGSFDNTFIR